MFARVTWLNCAVDQVDQFIDLYQRELGPVLDVQPGNVGTALLVNRGTGEGRAISYWDSADSLHATEDSAANLRDRAASAGVQIGEVDRLEIVKIVAGG